MGRGRAKAKQAKVARQLKYHSPNMDLEELQRELSGSKGQEEEAYSKDDDPYAQWADYFENEDERP